MMTRLLTRVLLAILSLRYRTRVRGLDAVRARGRTGIYFFPNHPAMMDPVILTAILLPDFRPRAVADARQVDRPVIRSIAKAIGVRTLPDPRRDGRDSSDQIERMLHDTIEGVKGGENALLYPAGHLARERFEDLGGNSGTELLVKRAPGARVVLVRTRGLWGSSFSWASGKEMSVGRNLRRGLAALLKNFLFFGPRRDVDIEFVEPADLPRTADRNTINRYLEAFYNADASPNTYVPYTIWESGGRRILPEPKRGMSAKDAAIVVPPATRELVLDRLKEASGASSIKDEDRLANELGLDSLARVELAVWLEKEFGCKPAGADAMQTVGEVMLAACGVSVSGGVGSEAKSPEARWFRDRSADRATVPDGVETITAAFLRQAKRAPKQIAVADATSGAKSYRELIAAVKLLRPIIAAMEGEYVGIMLPSSVAADVLFLSTLFAGKTPVMVNWTVGRRSMLHSLDLLGVKHVLTAGALVARLESEGADLAGIKERFILMEKVGKSIPTLRKVAAAISAAFNWSDLESVKPTETAAVLFTSGSESMPKAVPLTHANVLANVRDIVRAIPIREDDRLLGIAPPFHSMGLTVTMVLPLVAGFKVVHSPNPMDGAVLASLTQTYKLTLMVGTPTFLQGMARASEEGQLDTLRIVVTGAEKCMPAVYEAVAKRCPKARILEAYGITECAPCVSINDFDDPKPGTIGRMLPSLKWAVTDTALGRRLDANESGMLLVRGPSVFNGYLKHDGPSPFVTFEDESWYKTGDLVHHDENRVFTFDGRLKRFIKLGGEMISLPAIEAVLSSHYPVDQNEGPTLAVEATPTDEHPEVVLFTTIPQLTRETANAHIRSAGLSGLHNIRRVVRVDTIPVLGTGKTNYRALQDTLRSAPQPVTAK